MQIKSFFAGTIVGIAITVSAVMLLDQSDSKLDSAQSQAAIDSAAEAIEYDQTAPQTVVPRTVSATPDAGDVGVAIQEIDGGLSDTRGDSLQSIGPASNGLDRITVTDSHRQLIDQSTSTDPELTSSGNNHSELENEPLDHEWSYFMEQSIGQFLAGHPEIGYFDIAGIACRSTTCEIQSFGVDENAGPRWGLIIHDLRNQPWNDFGQTGASSGTIDGRLVILTHLYRLSEEE
jgi:hypothetical protein